MTIFSVISKMFQSMIERRTVCGWHQKWGRFGRGHQAQGHNRRREVFHSSAAKVLKALGIPFSIEGKEICQHLT